VHDKAISEAVAITLGMTAFGLLLGSSATGTDRANESESATKLLGANSPVTSLEMVDLSAINSPEPSDSVYARAPLHAFEKLTAELVSADLLVWETCSDVSQREGSGWNAFYRIKAQDLWQCTKKSVRQEAIETAIYIMKRLDEVECSVAISPENTISIHRYLSNSSETGLRSSEEQADKVSSNKEQSSYIN
jgi:hypothetical protein